jgi:hypothetical protein
MAGLERALRLRKMKPHNCLNTEANMLGNVETLKALPIGREGHNFSNHIARKYTIFRKSANLPALIFLRLFGIRMNKITNINRIESINNYFRLNLNLYFKMLSVVSPTLIYSTIARRETSSAPTYALPLKGGGRGGGVITRSGATMKSQYVMLNSFQHLINSIPYETLNQPMKQVQGMVQGDKNRLIQKPVESSINKHEKTSSAHELYFAAYDLNQLSFPQAELVRNPSFSERFRTSRNDNLTGTYVAVYNKTFVFSKSITADLRLRESSDPTMHLIHRLTPKTFRVTAASDYNAPYVILDKRTLPEKQPLTQITQTFQNLIARGRSPRSNLIGSWQAAKRAGQERGYTPLYPTQDGIYPLPFWERVRACPVLDTEVRGISPGMILNTQKASNPAVKIDTNMFSVFDYPEAGNNSKNVNYHRQEKTSASFNDIPHYPLPKRSNSLMHESEIDSLPLTMAKENVAMMEKHIVNKSIELILRKPITQNVNTVSESKDYQHKEEIISPQMTEYLTKDFKKRSAHEINVIADKVYKILEKRISIEKDRMGLR